MNISRRSVLQSFAGAAGLLLFDAHAQPAGGRIGVVLMHGKQGSPGYLAPLASQLQGSGFLVHTPEMPWSSSNYLAADWSQAMGRIAASAAALQASGASSLVLAGHSMGAGGALSYAAHYGGIGSLVLIAPGHFPGTSYQRSPAIRQSVDTARAMVRSGQGNQVASFADNNVGREFTVRTTAAAYLSYYDPSGSMVMMRNAARLPRGIAVLEVVGQADPLLPLQQRLFAGLRRNPRSQLVVVAADHTGTASAAGAQIAQWLRGGAAG